MQASHRHGTPVSWNAPAYVVAGRCLERLCGGDPSGGDVLLPNGWRCEVKEPGEWLAPALCGAPGCRPHWSDPTCGRGLRRSPEVLLGAERSPLRRDYAREPCCWP
jgi:hypothetical protein